WIGRAGDLSRILPARTHGGRQARRKDARLPAEPVARRRAAGGDGPGGDAAAAARRARPAARGGPRRVGGGARQAPRNVGCDRRLSRLSQSAVFAFRAFRLRNLHCDRIVLSQELFERRRRLLGAFLGLLHPSFGCVLGFDFDPLLVRRRQRIELAELELAGDRFEDFLELGVALPLEGGDVCGHGASPARMVVTVRSDGQRGYRHLTSGVSVGQLYTGFDDNAVADCTWLLACAGHGNGITCSCSGKLWAYRPMS